MAAFLAALLGSIALATAPAAELAAPPAPAAAAVLDLCFPAGPDAHLCVASIGDQRQRVLCAKVPSDPEACVLDCDHDNVCRVLAAPSAAQAALRTDAPSGSAGAQAPDLCFPAGPGAYLCVYSNEYHHLRVLCAKTPSDPEETCLAHCDQWPASCEVLGIPTLNVKVGA